MSLASFPQTLDSQLRFAIIHKRLVRLGYKGRPRIVEPHDYGIKNGTAKLLAYQKQGFGGARRTGSGEWRWFDIPKIESFTVLDDTFPGGREESAQDHHTWDVLYERVAPRGQR